MLLLVVVVAVAVGLARGGRLEGLSRLPFRGGIAILILFVAQLLIRQVMPTVGAPDSHLSVWLWCGVSIGLLLLCALNWQIVGIHTLALGIALNVLVVALNIGMPVGGSLAASIGMTPGVDSVVDRGGFYRMVDSGTVAPVLGDVIPIPAPRPLRSLVSLGDIIMFVGAGVLIEEGIRKGHYQARHAVKSQRTLC